MNSFIARATRLALVLTTLVLTTAPPSASAAYPPPPPAPDPELTCPDVVAPGEIIECDAGDDLDDGSAKVTVTGTLEDNNDFMLMFDVDVLGGVVTFEFQVPCDAQGTINVQLEGQAGGEPVTLTETISVEGPCVLPATGGSFLHLAALALYALAVGALTVVLARRRYMPAAA